MRFSISAIAFFLAATASASPILEKRIIGGGPVYKGELPFIAQILRKRGPCTGFVISPYAVLTAAHCVGDLPHTGMQYGGIIPKQGISTDIVKFVAHPAYNSSENLNDIGLVFVKDQMKLDYYPDYTGNYPKANTQVRAAGYGYTDNNFTEAKTLMKVDLNIATKTACAHYFLKFDSKTQFCTKDVPLGHAVCGGDSGGPVYTGEGRNIKIHGLSAHGITRDTCGMKGSYQYSTYIKPYAPWIRSEIRKYEKSLQK